MHERYDYLYSLKELDPWLDRVKAVEQATNDTYVVTNNHFLGKAVVNALEISSILRGQPVAVPPTLLAHYPELQEFAANETNECGGMPASTSTRVTREPGRSTYPSSAG